MNICEQCGHFVTLDPEKHDVEMGLSGGQLTPVSLRNILRATKTLQLKAQFDLDNVSHFSISNIGKPNSCNRHSHKIHVSGFCSMFLEGGRGYRGAMLTSDSHRPISGHVCRQVQPLGQPAHPPRRLAVKQAPALHHQYR
jgi:hypothetical protein